ncbi:MAG: class I SAM-dependent methyltransferase [Betaproteobacteria bacterium]|nr:class I SAM-dependent methyltransferase [Betaproteobacteria bacterium]MCC6249120.1 class I SAM-dependent methyltransferase [Rubrivivax sp.]MCL4698055.1 cyclopropane-fatty-acyl-phospholipid synthase family protein [Burkholderiaceae bacterium]
MIESLVEDRISRLDGQAAEALALVLPGGRRIGPANADVVLRLNSALPLRHLVTGNVGGLAHDSVEGLLDIEGPMRRVADVAAGLMRGNPTATAPAKALRRSLFSRWRHRKKADARQIRHHYDVSDDFYALWLDARRVYSCAYWAEAGMTLAAAQEAKLEHVCRKLMLRPGERFLDIGAGWGGLLLWAAEHHGVRATGITLSKNQHAHVNRLIADRGLADRVRMLLLDYRDLPEDEPYDKIASIGMFEHVGRARLPTYFAKIRRLLAPGGLLLNHGITAGGTRHAQLGSGIGDFVERWIFPGGELMHVAHVLEVMAEQGLEGLDTENLRPHYARTLWAWSDALESRLEAARRATSERTVRAYRLYLAGSAMGFERGWMALHQMLASRPSGELSDGALRGAQCAYPFKRDYMYARR